jgi:hypothetical protein
MINDMVITIVAGPIKVNTGLRAPLCCYTLYALYSACDFVIWLMNYFPKGCLKNNLKYEKIPVVAQAMSVAQATAYCIKYSLGYSDVSFTCASFTKHMRLNPHSSYQQHS